ncbi:MAG: LysR family transcriptional regulator [Bacteriovoracaceae bacterium]|nr:LysR family transcriptional regulator [Bacteriovoracaceae bacterium]
MDYRYVKAFILTARNSSFSKAAEELKIAQSAVSRQIKLLEESVGEELIIRSSKKVLLTQKGKELYIAAQHFDQLSSDIFEKEDNREIRVGILQGLLKNWFNPILLKFYKKYNRNITIEVGGQHDLRKGLENGLYDLIFTTENIQSDLISSLKLFDEKLILVSKEEVNRKKLSDYRWIVYSNEDNLFKLSKKTSSQIIKVESISTIENLVRNNVGIAILPEHVLKKSENLVVQDVSQLDKSEIYMATLSYKTMPAHINELVDVVKKSLQSS